MAGPEQKRIQSGEFNEASVKKVDEAALTDMRRFASNQTTLNARGTGADHIPLSLGERPVVDNRDLQGVPKSQEQDEQWAVEFSRDENRIVEILTSTFYTDDDQAEVIAILYRWAARRTLTVDKLAIELNLGLRSDLLDRLFYRLKREPVLGIQGRSSSFDALFKGRTNCYEILFSPSFDRADEVRAIRDTSSIDFIGRDERIDRARSEQTSEDLFAEGLFGWENNEFEFIGVDESTDAKYKAKLVINKLEETPPDCLTQIQKVICEGVRREGQNFLLRRYRVVTAGDKLRAAKALVKEVIVLILDYVLIELTAGVATAVLPKVLRMAIGATEGAGAAGGTLVSEVGVVSKAGAMEGGIGKELTATGKLESKGVALKVGSEAAPPPLFPMRPVSEIAPSKSLRNLAADTEKVATRTAPPLGKLKTPPETPRAEIINAGKQGPQKLIQSRARLELPVNRLHPGLPKSETSDILMASKQPGAQTGYEPTDLYSPAQERELAGKAKKWEDGAIEEPYTLDPEAWPDEGILIEPPKESWPKRTTEPSSNRSLEARYAEAMHKKGVDPHFTTKEPRARAEYSTAVKEGKKGVEATEDALANRLSIPRDRVKLKATEHTPAGDAQKRAARGMDDEAIITRKNGSKFNIDGFQSLGPKEYLFQEHKEIIGAWEKSIYSSTEGLSKEMRALLHRNKEIAKEFRSSGCGGWLYTTNEKKLAESLADLLGKNSGPVWVKDRWEVFQMVK